MNDGRVIYVVCRVKPRYTFLKFVGDATMTFLTAGLWLVWVFVREMRRY